MPLSDREQKILSEIEAHLRQEDPRFARTVGTATVERRARQRLRYAVVAFFVGLLMLFGLVASIWWGLVGFGVMLVAAVYGGNQLKLLSRGVAGQREGGSGGVRRYFDREEE